MRKLQKCFGWAPFASDGNLEIFTIKKGFDEIDDTGQGA